ncbi:MAG: hypothetical protein V3T70_08585, partial [Phycisphaerae bacterium]
PRYWFGAFGAVALLAVLAWRHADRCGLPSGPARYLRIALQTLLGITLAAGGALLIGGLLHLAGAFELPGLADGGAFAAACASIGSGLAIAALAVWGLRRRGSALIRHGPVALIGAILLLKPVQVYAYLPMRSALQSLRPAAERIDELMPPGAILYTMSDEGINDRSGEIADFDLYCARTVRWPLDIDALEALASDQTCYVVAREPARDAFRERFGARLEVIEDLDPLGKNVFLMRLDPPSATRPAADE